MNNNRNTVNNKGKNYKKGKGNKPYQKRDGEKPSTREESDYPQTDQKNDVAWYFKSAEMFEQAARLSFQNFLGRPVIDAVKIPSICTMYVNPSVGVSVKYDNTGSASRSGLNLAAQKLYTKLNIYSGRGSTYAPQDVAIMIGAISELISMFEYVRRCFGIVLFYNERNRDIPTKLLRAMGIDPDDFYDNQANYRKKFNKLVQSIDQLPLIMNITYIQKAMFMYQRVYTDTESLMAQMYLFCPSSTWILDESLNEEGSVLKTIPVCIPIEAEGAVTVQPMSARLTMINQMVDALLNSSTLNTIYADIYNLAQKTNDVKLFKMDILSDNYSVEPVYDAMMLNTIHNADLVGVPCYPRSGESSTRYVQRTPLNDVYCNANTNSIVYNPAMKDKSVYYTCAATPRTYKLLDLSTSKPTNEEVAEATRLAVFFYPGTPPEDLVNSQGQQLRLAYTLGDHYITEVVLSGGSTTDAPNTDLIQTSNNTFFGSTGAAQDLSYAQAMNVFNKYPIFYEYNMTTNTVDAINGEVDFNTRIDREWLDGVNDIIMLDMFDLR